MALMRATRRRLRAALLPLLFLGLVGYFGWNATSGEFGLKAYATRQHDLHTAEAGLARTQQELGAWEARVLALRAAHLDRDLLDERARAMLNLADPNEIVVPLPPAQHGN